MSIRTSIVLGSQYGDEGKGNFVQHLAKEPRMERKIVVRFNGGHQAGHTVIDDGTSHVCSSFGSGVLLGIPTYLSRYCTVYPTGFNREREVLVGKGLNPVCFVDPMCPVTTPYDVMSGRSENGKTDHGTCGVGFGKTVWRHETLEHSHRIFVKDLEYEWILREKLKSIGELYGQYVDIEPFLREVKVFCNSTLTIGEQELKQYSHVIFEGAQGILLDREHGIFPNVTRSHTTSKNALEIVGRLGLDDPHVYYVSRCYQTRHGNGPLQGEGIDMSAYINFNANETNVHNEWQGKFRYAPFNVLNIQYAIDTDRCYHKGNYNKTIVMTCLDQAKDGKVCILKDDGSPFAVSVEDFKSRFYGWDVIFISRPDF